MIFYIDNTPGSAQTITFKVTSIADTDHSCSKSYLINTSTCTIKEMPVVGSFE
jgi:hypothetical protein